ncbi:MAG: peptidoglycan DD-metalloendopeptidase family protein [Gammaproteobacteria bacterium]|nr:peptidoglycan DD-metalloendopeptidase family protein [Gammaproteobacteria bacterium]
MGMVTLSSLHRKNVGIPVTRGSYIKADYKRSALRVFAADYGVTPYPFRGPSLIPIISVLVLGAVIAKANSGRFMVPQQDQVQATAFAYDNARAAPHINLPLALPGASSIPPDREFSKRDLQSGIEQQTTISGARPAARPRSRANGEWHGITVAIGDTLSSIFSRLDIYDELDGIMRLGGEAEVLDSIYPGQKLRVRIGDRGMEELIFDPDYATRLSVIKTSEGNLQAKLHDRAMEPRRVVTSGVISRSLYVDGNDAGLSDLMIMKLAGLFGWDIDFALDIRRGDTFTVVHDEHYRQGQAVGSGNIVAAEFTSQGRVFRAIRYTDSNGHTGFYTPEGRSVRRPFLRTPVDVARISSHFDLNRRHPILNTIRAHRGVDYAASTGTPIKATGDAVLEERGYISGYGNTIILRHGSLYTTLYGHMSAFASGTSVGQRVAQGQTIGYIGSTGLATGPHLHYEFRINGEHQDPLTVALPTAKPLPETEKARFQQVTASMQARLGGYTRQGRLAMQANKF